MKRALIILATSALVLTLLLQPTQSYNNGQQDPPRSDCCFQIWATGTNLGWAASFLYYTSVRTRLEQPDRNWLDDLDRARQHVAAAHTACSAFNPAWKDWAGKQIFLSRVAQTVVQRPEPVVRRQAASSIGSTFGWANSLRVRVVQDGMNRREYEHDTCAEKYYKLGFLLGYAQQTLLIAEEAQMMGNNIWPMQVNDAKSKLRQSLQVLTEYFNLADCTQIEDLDLAGRIQNLLSTDGRYLSSINPEMRAIWESMQQRLVNSCQLGAIGPGPGPGPGGGPFNLNGSWLPATGGSFGFTIRFSNGAYQGTAMTIRNNEVIPDNQAQFTFRRVANSKVFRGHMRIQEFTNGPFNTYPAEITVIGDGEILFHSGNYRPVTYRKIQD